ncbi:hypothetical protein XELAEV_18037355mg [Xenopus laevis]|uniref:Reverse transcriptase domain-containing protein n=1 Tax=Xenopus laevis TaxID=8355 RepID=A0A974CCF3_XENLA|nr:hypothetical protein XELAEV_18037355mg [Xenopus laevis]
MHKIRTIIWRKQYVWVTLDVQSLYSRIHHVDGLRAINKFLKQYLQSDVQINFLLEAIEFILSHNTMSFNGQLFRQITGTAMGTKFAPSYAGLFMAMWEDEYIFGADNPYDDDIVGWHRYIDDVIMVWSGPEDDLKGFLNYVNDNPYDIKFTMQCHANQIDFLDLTFYVENNIIMSKLYRKKIAGNTILRKDSYHPLHTVKSIPYAQLMRIYRNCTDEGVFAQQAKEECNRLRSRGYSKRDISEAMEKLEKSKTLKKTKGSMKITNKQEKGVRCILEYGLQYKAVKKSIVKNWNILNTDPTIKALNLTPMVISRKAKSIANQVAPNRLNKKAEKKTWLDLKGFFPCKKCVVCKNNKSKKVIEFSDKSKSQEIKIGKMITCGTRYVVYAVQCECGALYIGRTIRQLRVRLGEHLRGIDNKDVDNPILKHFIMAHDGIPQKIRMFGIDKINENSGGNLTTKLLRLESNWIFKLGTIIPEGMNSHFELKPFLTSVWD